MAYRLSQRSLDRLQGVNPRLASVVRRAIEITAQDFGVAEGLRSRDRQSKLLAEGRTRTMRSKHLVQADGTGHAVDLYPSGFPDVPSIPAEAYRLVAQAMEQAAHELGVKIRWGNDWNRDGVEVPMDPDETFSDKPHFELWEV